MSCDLRRACIRHGRKGKPWRKSMHEKPTVAGRRSGRSKLRMNSGLQERLKNNLKMFLWLCSKPSFWCSTYCDFHGTVTNIQIVKWIVINQISLLLSSPLSFLSYRGLLLQKYRFPIHGPWDWVVIWRVPISDLASTMNSWWASLSVSIGSHICSGRPITPI